MGDATGEEDTDGEEDADGEVDADGEEDVKEAFRKGQEFSDEPYQASSDKMKHDMDEELIQKNNEIRELREKAVKGVKDLTLSRDVAEEGIFGGSLER